MAGENRRREIRKTEEPVKRSLRTAIAFALASLGLCANAGAKIVTFQIPVADGFMFHGMNSKGQVTGCYEDTRTGATHGFLVQPDGALTSFDVPVTRTNYPHEWPEMTCATGISADGVITGWYALGMTGGAFVRTAEGAITTFNIGRTANANAMNAKGWIVGSYFPDWKRPPRPFLRDPTGATNVFSVPGSVAGAGPTAVNRSRAIAGVAIVGYPTFRYQAFLRPAHGKAALFGDSHSASVQVTGINDAATVVGWFKDAGEMQHTIAFFRTGDGTLTAFTGPNGMTDAEALSINKSGTIVGNYWNSTSGHGFLRAADGTFTPFDIEGAYSTVINLINDKGVIAGNYRNKDGYFGFIGKP